MSLFDVAINTEGSGLSMSRPSNWRSRPQAAGHAQVAQSDELIACGWQGHDLLLSQMADALEIAIVHTALAFTFISGSPRCRGAAVTRARVRRRGPMKRGAPERADCTRGFSWGTP